MDRWMGMKGWMGDRWMKDGDGWMRDDEVHLSSLGSFFQMHLKLEASRLHLKAEWYSHSYPMLWMGSNRREADYRMEAGNSSEVRRALQKPANLNSSDLGTCSDCTPPWHLM